MGSMAGTGMLRGTDSAQLSFWSSATGEGNSDMANTVNVNADDLREAVRYLKDYYMSNVWRGEDKVVGGLSKLKSVTDRLIAADTASGK